MLVVFILFADFSIWMRAFFFLSLLLSSFLVLVKHADFVHIGDGCGVLMVVGVGLDVRSTVEVESR